LIKDEPPHRRHRKLPGLPSTRRRLPPPWVIEEHPKYFIVKDAGSAV
jgi:hypothetical protein